MDKSEFLENPYLVNADENGHVEFSDEAVAFVQRAIEAILGKLQENPSFRLMPYRYQGNSAEFLGCDWSDQQGRSVSFTFGVMRVKFCYPIQ
ncbi:MAG: hypothetical protein HC763_20510 [Hydrococcus sp. CRU_1_1]|nr:hypothetical protein [Hydrococcus sp. CRU_1_1]